LSQEAADPCDHAQHFIQAWRGRRECLVEQIGGLNFIRIEEQLDVQVGMSIEPIGAAAV